MLLVRPLGRVEYRPTWQAMRQFTEERQPDTPDELWLCEHPPVFTQGQAGRAEHLLDPGDIPVVATDRGGQVTYHGPGQVVAYPLVDLARLGVQVREYVFKLETAVLQVLEGLGVTGLRVPGAPGVYVRLADPGAHAAWTGPARDGFAGLGKVAALGLKLRRQRSYHGVALNVAMDLRPYARINPCGHAGLTTVDLATLGVAVSTAEVERRLAERLAAHLVPSGPPRRPGSPTAIQREP